MSVGVSSRRTSIVGPDQPQEGGAFRPAPRKRTFREAIRVLGRLSQNKNEVTVAAPILKAKAKRTQSQSRLSLVDERRSSKACSTPKKGQPVLEVGRQSSLANLLLKPMNLKKKSEEELKREQRKNEIKELRKPLTVKTGTSRLKRRLTI
eukprot:1129265_1